MNNFLKTGLASLLVLSSSASAQMPEFSDIGGLETREAIEFLKNSGIVEGYNDGTFKPTQSITRAEFTKIILETAQIPLKDCTKTEVSNINTTFSDVNSSDWFAQYVCKAQKSGLVKGYEDGTFKPNEEINFVESAKIITLAQDDKFIDLKKIEKDLESDFGTENVNWYDKYIVALEDENAIDLNEAPANDESFTREDMADVVWRLATGKEITETNEPLQIGSCAMLEKQIQKSKLRNTGGYFNGGNLRMIEPMLDEVNSDNPFGANTMLKMDSASESDSVATFTEDKSSDDFSTTNIQELGVDEADIVKNDGSHIFIARGEDVRIVKAYPQEEMQEDAVITVPNMKIQELFLDNDTLVLIGYKNKTRGHEVFYEKNNFDGDIMTKKIAPPYYNYNYSNFIEVRVFDISDRKNPVQTRSVSLEGNKVSTRKVGDILYVVQNNNLYNFEDATPLPAFSTNGHISRIGKCNQIQYFPNFKDQNLTTISAINIKDSEEKVKFSSILGAGNNIYSSVENLYVVQSDSKQEFVTEQDGSNTTAYWDWKDISRISKFSLNNGDVQFEAQGEVNGRVLNQYSMSEFQNNFRIATHKNRNWNKKK